MARLGERWVGGFRWRSRQLHPSTKNHRGTGPNDDLLLPDQARSLPEGRGKLRSRCRASCEQYLPTLERFVLSGLSSWELRGEHGRRPPTATLTMGGILGARLRGPVGRREIIHQGQPI
jgi:hypothetical protein